MENYQCKVTELLADAIESAKQDNQTFSLEHYYKI